MRIEGTLIPAGLHTFGRTWSTEAMAFMVASMISTGDTSIYRLLAADYGWIYDELTLDQRATLENRTLEMVMALLGGAKPEDITMAPDILQKLREASQYIELIGNSTAMEMTSLLNALDGGYVAAGLGRDPLMNPSALPTGRNFYTIDPSVVPTQAAYNSEPSSQTGYLQDTQNSQRRLQLSYGVLTRQGMTVQWYHSSSTSWV